MIEPPNFLEVDSWLRHLEIHVIQGIGNDLRHREVAKPFVIGWNDEPRRVFRGTFRQCAFKRIDVFAPQAAPGIIAVADLPLRQQEKDRVLRSPLLPGPNRPTSAWQAGIGLPRLASSPAGNFASAPSAGGVRSRCAPAMQCYITGAFPVITDDAGGFAGAGGRSAKEVCPWLSHP